MGVWQLLEMGLVMLLGLLGVLVPGVPGLAIVWAAVAWWALSDATGTAWAVLAGATGLLLLAQSLKLVMPPRRLRAAGAPRRSLLTGGVAAIAGFFLLPVVGGILGFLGGLYGAERMRLGSHGAGWTSARTVLRSGGYSVLMELLACLLVVGTWAGVVIWG
ncbi:DUF456 domain-containing protein [Streptomyces sp. TLI_146]|uniref:DUF456 domain-containing protein n=1 Tax=Streptomyces sp. TLI_146 TaxID=1938858 RepID=UPI0015D5868F|nr:DUF456 domain-containing protein [Streptomyces sp. TLI_146]